MSNRLLRDAWKAPCRSHSQKLLLARLADYADENGLCWPSIAALAKDCALSERAVQYGLGALAKDGFIKIELRGGRHLPNRYRVIHGNPAPNAPIGEKGCTRYGVIHNRKGANGAQKGARVAHQPSGTPKNPQGEPPIFRSKILKQLEEIRAEKNRLFRAHALENSLEGTSWRSPEAKAKFLRWLAAEKDCIEQLKIAI